MLFRSLDLSHVDFSSIDRRSSIPETRFQVVTQKRLDNLTATINHLKTKLAGLPDGDTDARHRDIRTLISEYIDSLEAKKGGLALGRQDELPIQLLERELGILSRIMKNETEVGQLSTAHVELKGLASELIGMNQIGRAHV